MLDAEPLLLVDDDESQILEFDFRIEQLMRADHHVDGAVLQTRNGVVDFLGGLESAHCGHIHREALIALGERLEMLLHQQRGRYEHGHLFGILHRLESGTYGDLRLAETDVAADETIHRYGSFHVGFDLVDGGELVGGLLIREGILQFLLPWRVFAEGVTGRTLAGRVQFDQILGDLVHVFTCLGFGGRPIRTAQFVEFRRLGADILADLIELVGGDEQFVGRGAAFARRIFDDQIFAGGFVGAGTDSTLTHFNETSDAVLLVHHVIAGFQFHQIDGLAPALRGFGLARSRSAAGQVTLGQQCCFRRIIHESVDGTGSHALEVGDAGFVDGAFQAGQRALCGCRDGHVIASCEQPLNAGGGLVLVTTIFAWIRSIDSYMAGQTGIHTETGEFPNVMLRERKRRYGLFEVKKIRLIEGDGRTAAMTGRGHMPAGSQKLVGGFGQIIGASAQFFRIGKHNQRIRRQHALHRFHVVDERRQQRFHTLYRNGVGDGFQHILGVGNGTDQGLRPIANGVRQLQFTAWRGPDAVQRLSVRTLVGSMELLDGIDFVTKEFDTHRMRQRRRKYVDDASTHGEFSTVHHKVHTRIGALHQSFRRFIERQFLALREYQRFDVAKTGHYRLNQGSHRHYQNADRTEHGIPLFGVFQPAEHRHAAGHRIGTGRQTFMRQRFPSLQLGHILRVATVPGTNRLDRLLRLPPGSDNEHDRPAAGGTGRQSRP